MKNNVINSQYSIPFGQNGEITVLGKFPGHVLIMVKDDPSSRLGNLPRQDFMRNQAFAYSMDKGEPTFVFEYKLESELRNPRKLLRSVRNKIMGAIRLIDDELNTQDYEWQEKIGHMEKSLGV